MKYASLAISVIAILLSVYTLATRTDGAATPTQTKDGDVAVGAASSIVFVYADSIYANYQEFADQQAALEQRGLAAEQDLQQKQQALENEVRRVQTKVQQGLLTPNQIAAEEQRIGRQQQQMMAQRDQIAQELMQESQVLNEAIQTKVRRILTELKNENGYDYILSYAPGSGVVMANDAHDITDILLERLNASATTTTTPAADSTDEQ